MSLADDDSTGVVPEATSRYAAKAEEEDSPATANLAHDGFLAAAAGNTAATAAVTSAWTSARTSALNSGRSASAAPGASTRRCGGSMIGAVLLSSAVCANAVSGRTGTALRGKPSREGFQDALESATPAQIPCSAVGAGGGGFCTGGGTAAVASLSHESNANCRACIPSTTSARAGAGPGSADVAASSFRASSESSKLGDVKSARIAARVTSGAGGKATALFS